MSNIDARRLGRIQRTGAWLLVIPLTINGTELGAQTWREYLFQSYGIDPPDLLSCCDGCGLAITICHTMDCKKGFLIIVRHNKLRYSVSNLAGNSFIPTHMRNDPKIFTGCAVCVWIRPRPRPRENQQHR